MLFEKKRQNISSDKSSSAPNAEAAAQRPVDKHVATLKSMFPTSTIVPVRKGSVYTQDYNEDRCRVFYDKSGKVVDERWG